MKNAIVTGASTGIGQAVAVALGRGGYAVYLIARTQQKLEKTKDKTIDNRKGWSGTCYLCRSEFS